MLADVDAFGVAVGDGQGVGEAPAIAVADALADDEGVDLGVGVGVGVGVALAFGEAEPLGVGVVAAAQKLGMGAGVASSVKPAGEAGLPLPSSNKAAGTTSSPRMTVTTKARAPHSWSQKARDELRIRVLRPTPVAACCAC